MQKTALITGCSSGFGLSMTHALLDEGWKVIATVRNPETSLDLKKIFHPSLTILKLDVTCQEDQDFVQHYIEQELKGKLDCLINNAGFGLFGPIEELTEEQIRYQLEVNLFGVIFLTQRCLPFLRKTKGRIINISSVLGYVGFPLQGLYVTSKFALEGFTETLHYELAPHGVQVSLVEPGAHHTRFGDNVILSTDNKSDYALQKANFSHFRNKLSTNKNGTSEQIAKCVVKLLKTSSMPLRRRIGKDANLLYFVKRFTPTFIFNQLLKSFFKKTFIRT